MSTIYLCSTIVSAKDSLHDNPRSNNVNKKTFCKEYKCKCACYEPTVTGGQDVPAISAPKFDL
ncbi:hypothetical protein M8C21_022478 [Ambrosia artemisiifolia]|uniref:Uncharacterized protein n=1 Tax=Ambrosia artemisiifolia TaxID=4212 RepID=A0AAD5CYZ9_AMBAR|nr:hypothetical protein M8C21_022478 [Ambrosia artemisiifolia]